jgi:uncharacterized RDD family membrane protein YckC
MNAYAGFWVRLLAYFIDFVVLIIAQFAIFAVFGVSLMAADPMDPDAANIFATTGGMLAYAITVIGSILYFVLLESSAKQGTLGKMALGLIVTDTAGRRISAGRAVGRYFAKILSGLILLIGYIMIAFTERKQGLHDLIASTYVIKGRPGEAGVDPAVFE